MSLQHLDGDQRRETVNTRQRYDAWSDARNRMEHFRGSMTFTTSKGSAYLVRSFYDRASGIRRQTSLGPRSPDTESQQDRFRTGRQAAAERLAATRAAIERQAGINRALGLGRVPDLSARILRAIESTRLLGRGLCVVGTHALYAYEAAAGVMMSSELTTTEDVDLLLDARRSLAVMVDGADVERSLIGVLRRVDRSFSTGRQTFPARNRDGFLVDLIKPIRNPPWPDERSSVGSDEGDLDAAAITGLVWIENAPIFRAVAIDRKGLPTPLVVPDPRAFAVHKLWLSRQDDRDPLKRRRDAAQARAAAALVTGYMPHLPFDPDALRSFPKPIVDAAAPLFAGSASDEARFDG